MPSSENSSPMIDVLKRLVAQQKSARHQYHEPVADELTSCSVTSVYDEVAHDLAPDQRLSNNRAAVTTSQSVLNKVATTPSQSKMAVVMDQPIPSKAATASSQSKVAVTADQLVPSKKVSFTSQAAGSQQPIANSQQPERHTQRMSAWSWLHKLLDFRENKAGDMVTIKSPKGNMEFRGVKLWTLTCVILVAPIGFNINSTTMIIGVMLISPLMGPTIGFGPGFGIADLDLVRKSLRSLVLTILFSITTVTIYFLLTPLDQPGNELLGRTEPLIYNVLIAFFSGAVGLVAGSSRSKGQVLPGVAVATALMPPLCTVGLGMVTGNWAFFFGATYLYVINPVFIVFATFVMAHTMRFPVKATTSGDIRKQNYRWIIIIAVCTLVPGICLNVRLVRDSYQEQRARQLVANHFVSLDHQVICQSPIHGGGGKASYIGVVLISKPLSAQAVNNIATLLPGYGLSSLELQVHQGLGNEALTDYEQLDGALPRGLYKRSRRMASEQRAKIGSPRRTLLCYDYYKSLIRDMSDEVRVVSTGISQVRLMSSMEFIQG